MRYDKQTVERARSTDMVAFLSWYSGLTFNSRGGEYRSKEHPSLSVKADRRMWYWHSKGIGGTGAVDYLMKVDGMSFRDAMAKLVGITPEKAMSSTIQEQVMPIASAVQAMSHPAAQPARTLILPEKAGFLYKRLYTYLNQTRGIDSGIITALIKEKKIYEDKRGNVVFVGYDENNVARFASLRSTNTVRPFRMDCSGSDKRYGFHMDGTNTGNLYIFESGLDGMSYGTLENLKSGNEQAWRNYNLLSLGGTSSAALDKYLELHRNVGELVFCLDSDRAGREAAAILMGEYTKKGYITRSDPSQGKDYNEDLIKLRKEGLTINEQKKCRNYNSR